MGQGRKHKEVRAETKNPSLNKEDPLEPFEEADKKLDLKLKLLELSSNPRLENEVDKSVIVKT